MYKYFFYAILFLVINFVGKKLLILICLNIIKNKSINPVDMVADIVKLMINAVLKWFNILYELCAKMQQGMQKTIDKRVVFNGVTLKYFFIANKHKIADAVCINPKPKSSEYSLRCLDNNIIGINKKIELIKFMISVCFSFPHVFTIVKEI